jgi:ubiquitin carboxyl-terminal hydrolase 4/11/15
MSERSYSHKSDGRQSSTGHSVTSGRANSLTGFGLSTPIEAPGLAPGLFILGSVPAIIRCWLNTNFKHDTLLYAAVCSGSYTSYLDIRMIDHLGFREQITRSDSGEEKIKLHVYLPEAIPVSASSRSNSPAPQLPSLGVDFTVVNNHGEQRDSKPIQIFLGSDMLRAHNADILFSTNQLTLYDDEYNKLQIPLVRPEDERTFKSLFVTSGSIHSAMQHTAEENPVPAASEPDVVSGSSNIERVVAKLNGTGTTTSSDDGGSTGRQSLEQRPSLGLTITSRAESKEGQESSPSSAAPQSGPSTAIWSNWRRDTEKAGSMDWANVSKTPPTTYQRRDTGIKVLKPTKPGVRTLSTTISQSSSPATTGQSRFFDEGKRRLSNTGDNETSAPHLTRSVSGEKPKENMPTLAKTRSANPIGGASAFAWLNSGGK